MSIITLTSDLGLHDYYVSAVKGYILKRNPAANIVDISHLVQPFNIAQASFILRNSFPHFPEGTIHLVNIDANTDNYREFVLVKVDGHFFIARNNGIITLITESNPQLVVKLAAEKQDYLFPMRDICARYACSLLAKKKATSFGESGVEMNRMTNLRPMLEKDFIRGSIIYIDNHGNAFTNIRESHIGRYGESRKLIIHFSRTERFTQILQHYNNVPEGEKVCFFNSSGHLEIALNKSNASQLLGLQVGNTIMIEFLDK